MDLYEASGRLGGQLTAASVPQFKWPLKRYLDWLIIQTEKRDNIRILLNTPASPALIREKEYDACIAALGAVPKSSALPGADGKNVITAVEALLDGSRVKGKVVVIGGGETGVETAVHLGRTGHRTTILARRRALAESTMVPHVGTVIMHAVESTDGLDYFTGVSVVGIEENGVRYRHADGSECFAEADTVVLASGSSPLQDESMAYYGIVPETWVIGDCTEPSNLMFANRMAYAAANNI